MAVWASTTKHAVRRRLRASASSQVCHRSSLVMPMLSDTAESKSVVLWSRTCEEKMSKYGCPVLGCWKKLNSGKEVTEGEKRKDVPLFSPILAVLNSRLSLLRFIKVGVGVLDEAEEGGEEDHDNWPAEE